MLKGSYKSYPRSVRIESQIQKLLSTILQRLLPNDGFITITNVKVSNDCKHAKVFINSYNKTPKEALTEVYSKESEIKKELARQIRLKRIPKLVFSKSPMTDDNI